MSKRWLTLIALGIVALLTGSCMKVSLVPGPNGNSGTGTEPPNAQRTVLEFWHTYSDIETEMFESRVLPLFEEQHPGIQIHAVRKDYTDQLKDAILAAVADNKAPDIMRMDIIWVPELAKYGALTDITAMEGFHEIRDLFIGSLIQTNYYEGKYYGLPVNASTRAAIFNKKLLHEAGLEQPPRTFAEVVEAVERLRQAKPDVYGIGICCSNGWGSLPYFWTFGGKLMDEQFTRASGYLDGPDSKAALEKLKNWYDLGWISPSITGGEPGTWDGILRGRLLMIDDAHWFYTVNAAGESKELLEDVVITLMPDDVQEGTSVIGGENLVLFDKSTKKQEAWEFMRWMMTEEPQQIMAETGLIPTIKNLQYTNQNPLFTPYLEQLNRANPRPPVPAWTEIEDIFARMVERILTNEQTIRDATREATDRIDVLLMQ
jgi:multiple sugar transport system substrate-binding protein